MLQKRKKRKATPGKATAVKIVHICQALKLRTYIAMIIIIMLLERSKKRRG
jgi:hypothetical protein